MSDDSILSWEFQRAVDADASGEGLDHANSLQFWTSIANGDIYYDEIEWMKIIAKRVLEANREKGNRRPDAMLAAVGLAGRDKHAELRRFLDRYVSFENLDTGEPPRMKEMIAAVRAAGFADDTEGDDGLRVRVHRILKELNKVA